MNYFSCLYHDNDCNHQISLIDIDENNNKNLNNTALIVIDALESFKASIDALEDKLEITTE